MSQKIPILSSGLALFAMFFGAGNIIFPLLIGRMSGTETPYAVLGLGLSAVAFPFLGLLAMIFYGGRLKDFLAKLGKWPAFVLLFILQMSQGPVGAMPRLVTLMYSSVKPYLPITLLGFSLVICLVIFVLTVRPQKIVQLLGTLLTPLLLLTLALLIVLGLLWAPEAQPVMEGSSYYFGQGLKMGYQTMDLIAALLFAVLILPHLSQGTNDKKTIRRRMLYASLIASGLLMLTYIGLCWLASHHLFPDAEPQDLLHQIAIKVLGPVGGVISSIAIFLACFTTAISLAAVFSSYLKEEIKKVQDKMALGITLGITAIVANLGFSGIVKLWGPVLELLYPILIVLCLYQVLIAKRSLTLKPISNSRVP